jgi:hypothetical protein
MFRASSHALLHKGLPKAPRNTPSASRPALSSLPDAPFCQLEEWHAEGFYEYKAI